MLHVTHSDIRHSSNDNFSAPAINFLWASAFALPLRDGRKNPDIENDILPDGSIMSAYVLSRKVGVFFRAEKTHADVIVNFWVKSPTIIDGHDDWLHATTMPGAGYSGSAISEPYGHLAVLKVLNREHVHPEIIGSLIEILNKIDPKQAVVATATLNKHIAQRPHWLRANNSPRPKLV